MRYFIARLGQMVVTVFGASIFTFTLPFLFESNFGIARQMLGPRAPKALLNHWLLVHGFDDSIVVQYWHWLWPMLHGNFGIAYYKSTEYHIVLVKTLIGGTVWDSVWLVVPPTIISILLAMGIGLTQAMRRNKVYDHTMTTLVYVLYSTPTIIICIVIAYYFGAVLQWAQPGLPGSVASVTAGQFPSWIYHNFSYVALPYLALIVLSVGSFSRFMRGSALDTMIQDHVRTARAKGGGPVRVLFRHIFRPSVIPMVTLVGLTVPAIIGGALIVEVVFNWPGMGLLAVQSVSIHDFNTVMAITVFTTVLTVMGNFLADVFVAVADPRVRLTAAR